MQKHKKRLPFSDSLQYDNVSFNGLLYNFNIAVGGFRNNIYLVYIIIISVAVCLHEIGAHLLAYVAVSHFRNKEVDFRMGGLSFDFVSSLSISFILTLISADDVFKFIFIFGSSLWLCTFSINILPFLVEAFMLVVFICLISITEFTASILMSLPII